tara:strand:+ start:8 stop:682 length:675 start_codon:yes stop_codon:yes gene_type:complete
MINSWSLLYDELYEDDEMNTSDYTVGVSTESFGDNSYYIDPGTIENITIDTSNYDAFTGISTDAFTFAGLGTDTTFIGGTEAYPTATVVTDSSVYAGDCLGSSGYETLNIEIPPDTFVPEPSINKQGCHKYEEDKSIKALQDYVSTTYGGHYTSDKNDVQTLDLIESVGDAEAFCRSNALKYLSRYDKKGQAKRDILKALHYTLLLYYFSGQLHETPTRGYETF